MSNPDWTRVRPILEELLELSPEERERRLAELCGRDEELAGEVRRLLLMEEELESNQQADVLGDTAFQRLFAHGEGPRPGAEQAGYRIERELGAGGMGQVYEALQANPERVVALKVLAPSMVTERHVARFREEARFLARLQHPGIAQVYDAGIWTDSAGNATPYFAMEFVPGARTLNQYGLERGLSLRDRVALFVRVCEAVHHGHTKGILHRDLKPGNILVGEDGNPKVIDYGVARAMNLEETLTADLTRTGEVLGTIRYMSPEQVQGLPLDARSDVYTLGVVLYEFLCDQLPYPTTRQDLASIAVAILGVQPLRPGVLNPGVRGDLEWVLMRALEKEPERRYPTAAALAEDLNRYLDHKPLSAGPPSTVYRIRKFVLRNPLAVGASILLVVGLSVGAAAVLHMYIRSGEERVRRELEAQHREAAQASLLTSIRSLSPEEGTQVRVDMMLESASESAGQSFAGDSLGEIECRTAITSSYLGLGLFELAEEEARLALQIAKETLEPHDPRLVKLRTQVSTALYSQGKDEEALRLSEELLERMLATVGEEHVATAQARAMLGDLRVSVQGDLVSGERLLRQALEVLAPSLGEESLAVLNVESKLANCLSIQGRSEQSLALHARVREILVRTRGPSDFQTILFGLDEATALAAIGHHQEALALAESLYEMLSRDLVERHPMRLRTTAALAQFLLEADQAEGALELLQPIQELMAEVWGPVHHETLKARSILARALEACGEAEFALKLRRETLVEARATLGERSPKLLPFLAGLGQALLRAGELDAGFEYLEESLEIGQEIFGADHPDILSMQIDVGDDYGRHGQPGKALEKALLVRSLLEGRADADPYLMASAQMLEGKCLVVLDRKQEASAPLREALDYFRVELGPESRVTLEVQRFLGYAE